MNRRIDLTKLGGYPLAQEDLDWMQTSFRGAFAALADVIGDKVIISGMTEAGGNVSAGWIAIGGELIPFAAGTIGTGEFILDETPTNLTFNDGVAKQVLFERVARFSAGGAYQYADLVRMTSLKNMWLPGDIKEKYCSMVYLAANFDGDGYGLNRETGWRILGKALPDTLGKTMVNYDPADADFNTIGNHGGEKAHTLTANEIPALTLQQGNSYTGNPGPANVVGRGDANRNTIPLNAGGGQPHNNMQPYYVVLKLIKL